MHRPTSTFRIMWTCTTPFSRSRHATTRTKSPSSFVALLGCRCPLVSSNQMFYPQAIVSAFHRGVMHCKSRTLNPQTSKRIWNVAEHCCCACGRAYLRLCVRITNSDKHSTVTRDAPAMSRFRSSADSPCAWLARIPPRGLRR